MPGGLLNIVANGNQNIILNGNPSKTFFTTTYSKYTNFGMQKIRVDYDGQKILNFDTPTTFSFKIPRYAELLMDTYLVVNLPTIWSPIVPPDQWNGTKVDKEDDISFNNEWRPYEFKWIENLGCQMIDEIVISVGRQIIQKYSGDYLYNLVERDFSETKKKKFYNMTGNIPELNDPGNAFDRLNQYPNAAVYKNGPGPDPSIRGRKLYIPINSWFSMSSKMSFPLISLQYNELHIDVKMRPIRSLYKIRDVNDQDRNYPYVSPNISVTNTEFYKFIQPPTDINLNNYPDKRNIWNTDIHLICNYCFLSEDEINIFALKEQKYLIKNINEYKFFNITGTNKLELKSHGLVSNWMWFFRRNDAHLRNEWTNYTNWPYNYIPYSLKTQDDNGELKKVSITSGRDISLNPFQDAFSRISPNGTSAISGLAVTPEYSIYNHKEIMHKFGILLNGKYRENMLDSGIYNYIEKYNRSHGNSNENLYCYNFCLNTDPSEMQPSGAINMSKFNKIEFEFEIFEPNINSEAVKDSNTQTCVIRWKNENGVDVSYQEITYRKNVWNLFDYAFDLHVMEEKYNILSFQSGNAGLMFSL